MYKKYVPELNRWKFTKKIELFGKKFKKNLDGTFEQKTYARTLVRGHVVVEMFITGSSQSSSIQPTIQIPSMVILWN